MQFRVVWLVVLMAIHDLRVARATSSRSEDFAVTPDVSPPGTIESATHPAHRLRQHHHRHQQQLQQLDQQHFDLLQDDQVPSTSTPSSTEASAYHRLRHAGRQRRRQRNRKPLGEGEVAVQADAVFKIIRKLVHNDQRQRKHHHKDLTTKRERNEALCDKVRNTVHMNTPNEEYDPPFMLEIRCKNVDDFAQSQGRTPLRPQNCVHNLLRCVQTYKDVHFSRRKVGSNSWHPFTVPNVPSGCDCMWPVDKYGHQEL